MSSRPARLPRDRRIAPCCTFPLPVKPWSASKSRDASISLQNPKCLSTESAILLRHPGRYQPLVEEALRRASVPAYFSRGVVRPDPAGRAFLALLACALEECSASRFAEYLSLGQVPSEQLSTVMPPLPSDELLRAFTVETVDPPVSAVATEDKIVETDEDRAIAGTLQAPAGWEDLLIDASVIGGADRWERRLRGLENELKVKTKEAARSEESRSIRTELDRLRNLEAFALPLIRELSALPRSALWREYIDLLSDLARASLRRPESVLGVLAELAPMADVGPVRLDEAFHVLSDRLRTLRRDPPERRYGRVFVGSIDEARGRFFKAVFLPGLAEGLFPAIVAEDPLLLDTYRAAVSPDLHTNKQRREQERLLLRIALAAGESVVFSYPRIDLAQSRPRVPSFYALEIIRAANGHLPPLQEFQSAAAAAAPTRLDRPAPDNFASAIDDTEYDLVALEHVKAGGVEQDGALHYLTSVNAALGRSLRTRYQRWNVGKWTAADGLFDAGFRQTLRADRTRLLSDYTSAVRFLPLSLRSAWHLRAASPGDSRASLSNGCAHTWGAVPRGSARPLPHAGARRHAARAG